MTDYKILSDEELITLVRKGDPLAEEFLYDKYKQLVRSKARSFFLVGSDREDLIQEGMIGLYRAVCEYSSDKNVSFLSFANLCVTRQIITAVKAATRKKHQPLNNYVSFSQPVNDGDETERTLIDILEHTQTGDPEQELISRESYEQIAHDIRFSLSSLEKKTLSLYLQGLSYQQISLQLGRSTKCVDNAIQRIKKKLEARLNQN